ncbi:hypothetical protein L914_15404, partial [Phytophthora nicotianae]
APQKIWHQAGLLQEGALCGTLLATTAPRRVCCAGQPARGSDRAVQGKCTGCGASWWSSSGEIARVLPGARTDGGETSMMRRQQSTRTVGPFRKGEEALVIFVYLRFQTLFFVQCCAVANRPSCWLTLALSTKSIVRATIG